MSEPFEPRLSLPGRPPRVSRRNYFLVVSFVIVVAVLFAAREVLLPFILALLIAYVFTPGVVAIERRGIPRWLAIVGLYVVTLGTFYGFGALAAPRIALEGRALVREVPKLLKHLQEEVIPAWEYKLQGLSDTAEEAGPQAPARRTT